MFNLNLGWLQLSVYEDYRWHKDIFKRYFGYTFEIFIATDADFSSFDYEKHYEWVRRAYGLGRNYLDFMFK